MYLSKILAPSYHFIGNGEFSAPPPFDPRGDRKWCLHGKSLWV